MFFSQYIYICTKRTREREKSTSSKNQINIQVIIIFKKRLLFTEKSPEKYISSLNLQSIFRWSPPSRVNIIVIYKRFYLN